MSRILFAWELGANFGHLSKQLPVARLLHSRGHEVLFASKDIGIAHRMLAKDGFRFVQSPLPRVRGKSIREPASFADILAEFGFSDHETLSGLIRAWQSLFEVYRPDVLVGDYAPAAQFAARLSGLPCMQLATGFDCPPALAPFPCFRPWLGVTQEALLEKEKLLLNNLNAICSRQNVPVFSSLQQALRADITLLATLPELDHYPGRDGRYIGPLFSVDDGAELHWSERDAPRIFVYLRQYPELSRVLEALSQCGANVIAFIPGIGDEQRQTFSSEHLQISASPVKLAHLMSRMNLTIIHAGHGLAAASLLAGVPMLMIPTNIEQWLLTHNIERLGAGIGVARDAIQAGFVLALEELLADTVYREKAGTIAGKYGSYNQSQVVERIANTVERLPQHMQGMADVLSELTLH